MLLFPAAILTISDESDRDFMKHLYINHAARMFRVARALTDSKQDAEDVVGEACVALIRKISLLRTLERNVLEGYIISTVKNAAYALHRRRKSRKEADPVEAFPVSHGTLISYGYKFVTADRTIVISGDTAPLDIVAEKAAGCDILLHEVEYSAGIACREPKWQKYHQEVHTLSTDLAKVAQKAKPKLLVTYHRIYHMNIQDNHINLEAEMRRRDDAILDEIRAAGYEGMTVNGRDLEVF